MGMQRNAQAALFGAALLAGTYQFFHLVGTGFGQGFEMAAVAKNLALHGSYANPFAPAITGPTALVPPLYPLFLAALIKAFGSVVWMALIANGVNILANAAIAALLPELSNVFFGDWKPGAFGGLLWIATMRLMPQWDASCTLAGLIVFTLFTARTIRPGDAPLKPALGAGFLAGALMLLNPAAIWIFVPWEAFLLFRRKIQLTHAIRYASAAGVVVLAMNAPWVLRNYRIWHKPMLRTSFGITLYSSNNYCAESSLIKDAANGCFQATHPVASAAEVSLLNQLGEVQYDQNRASAAWSWIRSNPGRFTRLTIQRAFEFWFPDPMVPPYTIYAIWLVTALSIPGMALLMRRRQPITLFILTVWAGYPLMYYLVVTCDRYRYPILWTSLLPAGYYLTSLLPSRRKRPDSAAA